MNLSKQTIYLSAIALFIMMVVFGPHFTMMTDNRGNMTSCPFMAMQGVTAICPMGTIEHVAKWQSVFAATVPTVTGLFFALALIIFGVYAKDFKNKDFVKTGNFYKHNNLLPLVFDRLRTALSRGILHTKIYDPFALVG